jgi:hypothetical protein
MQLKGKCHKNDASDSTANTTDANAGAV